VTAFRDCALAFRFTAIDRLPDDPTIWTVRGTFVHRVLERLFWHHGPGGRSRAAARHELEGAWVELLDDADFRFLALDEEQRAAFRSGSEALVDHYFELEDPDRIHPVGLELTLEADVAGVRLRGIVDRLDRREDGSLVIVDYKTGRAPSVQYEQSKLVGVHLYALLCREALGQAPAEVRLLHLREPMVIATTPTEQSLRGQRTKTGAIWSAIERACDREDFRPRPSPLCNYCRFREFCPTTGGDPDQARVRLSRRERTTEPAVVGAPPDGVLPALAVPAATP
jgi:putative RecB family exonuclease